MMAQVTVRTRVGHVVDAKVLESLGWQPSAGVYAKRVQIGNRTAMVVKGGGGKLWREWTVRDRIRPGGPQAVGMGDGR